MMRQNRKGAIELSMTTIIILVLGVSMLVLGIVLIRSIMCGAVGLTSDVNSKVKGEISKLFDATEGEVSCVGAGSEPVKMTVGRENIVFCSIRAPAKGNYVITLKSYEARVTKTADLKKWILDDSWTGTVAPGDETPKKAVRIQIPTNAPEDNIRMQLEVTRDGELISTQDLDFETTRLGFFRASVC